MSDPRGAGTVKVTLDDLDSSKLYPNGCNGDKNSVIYLSKAPIVCNLDVGTHLETFSLNENLDSPKLCVQSVDNFVINDFCVIW